MLKWVFGADTGPFRKGLNDMRGQVKGFSSSVSGQLAGMFGGAALLAGAAKIISSFARIKDLADRFGESSESIQRISAASAQAGTDIEAVSKGMTKATANAVAAANGNDELAAAFGRMGINAAEFANMPIEAKLLALAKGYDESATGANGLSDVMKIMGKSGAEAIPLLTQGYAELKAAMDRVNPASNETVAIMASLDDKFAEMQQVVSVWGATLIGKITAVTSTIGILWGGVFDIIGSGFNAVVTMAGLVGDVITKTFSGDFEGAKNAASAFFQATKGGFDNVVGDAEKAAGAVKEAWKDTAGVNDGEASTAAKKAVEDAKAAAEAKIESAKEQMNLAKQIADLEEKARVDQLSMAEKILDVERKRAELAGKVATVEPSTVSTGDSSAQGKVSNSEDIIVTAKEANTTENVTQNTTENVTQNTTENPPSQAVSSDQEEALKAKLELLKLDKELADLNKKDAAERLKKEEDILKVKKEWNELLLEKKRSGMSDSDQIKSLQSEQETLKTKGNEAKASGDDALFVELGKKYLENEGRIEGLQKGIDDAKTGLADAEKSNAFAGMTDEEKMKSLQADRDKAKAESDAAFKAGDEKTGIEKKTKAAEITGQIDDIKRSETDKAKSDLESLQSRGPTIATSSLADIGGGGGVSMMENDYGKKQVDLLAIIAANTAGGSEGSKPPEPI